MGGPWTFGQKVAAGLTASIRLAIIIVAAATNALRTVVATGLRRDEQLHQPQGSA
jgi:hypothetical protein